MNKYSKIFIGGLVCLFFFLSFDRFSIEKTIISRFETTRYPIYTYYQPLTNSIDFELLQILQIWAYAFYAHGFYPIVLNKNSIRTRTNLDELVKTFSSFPTVNPKNYELNCYLRWIALAERGGGILMDYDILPMLHSNSKQLIELKNSTHRQLITYKNSIPMIARGNVRQINKWIDYMLNFNLSNTNLINGKRHISDMIMAHYSISNHHDIFTVKPKLSFVHYSHHMRATVFARLNRSNIEVKFMIKTENKIIIAMFS